MSFKINGRQVGDVTILDCVGRLTLGPGSRLFREAVREQLNQGKNRLLINLGETTYTDSSGAGELMSALTVVANHGGSLKLLQLTKNTKDVLIISKLYADFEVYEDEVEAIRSFH